MSYFLRALFLYLLSVLLGLGLVLLVLPVLSEDLLPSHLPANNNAFVDAYFFHSLLVWGAATTVALGGLLMPYNRPLRRATLTLPLWTPVLHALFVLALAIQ